MTEVFKGFAQAYQEVLEKQKHTQFYGLRDFYSLVKMLFWMCKTVKQQPNSAQIEHVILRNFSGHSSDDEIDIVKIFNDKITMRYLPPNKDESKKNCEGMQRNEFKRAKFTHITELFFQKFCEMHQDETEEQLKQNFEDCCKNGDFHNQEMNKKFEEEFQKYFDHKFNNEVCNIIYLCTLYYYFYW